MKVLGAMLNRDEVIDLLKTKDSVEVKFIKKDGTVRVMKCTLNPKNIPTNASSEGSNRKKNLSSIAVYDMEKEDWRSFLVDSIMSITYDIK